MRDRRTLTPTRDKIFSPFPGREPSSFIFFLVPLSFSRAGEEGEDSNILGGGRGRGRRREKEDKYCIPQHGSLPPPSPQTQNRRFHLDFLLLPLFPGYDRHVCRSGAKAASTSSSSTSPSSWVIHSIKGETASFPRTDAGRRRRDLDDSSAKKITDMDRGEKKVSNPTREKEK